MAPPARPLKVCIVVPYDLSREGGVKKHAVHVAQALRRLGDEVDVIGPSSQPTALPEGIYGFGGAQEISTNGSTAQIGLFPPPPQIWRHFRSRRYDIVHLHEPLVPMLNYWALLAAGHAARLCTFHSFSESAQPGRPLRLLASLTYRGIGRGIAVSLPAERSARTMWKRPLTIIPNGVPTSLFVPPPPTTSSAGPLRLLFVGHFSSPRKGLPHLLTAYKQLRAAGREVVLDVIGDGGATPPEPLPGVTYHGPIASERELAAHYGRCDLFIAPATGQESFGIVLLEAMATERAVICSDIEGYRSAVGEGEHSGARLVTPGSASALASAISELGADPAQRREMGRRNRLRALEFDWERITLRIRAEYLLALAERHASRRRPPDSRLQ